MAIWNFVKSNIDRHIFAGSCDYNTAFYVNFVFDEVKNAFMVPNDVTKEEMVSCLEKVVENMKNNKSGIIIPTRYQKERQEAMKQEENE